MSIINKLFILIIKHISKQKSAKERCYIFNDYPDILTVDEVCEILRIGYNAIYANLNSGKLRAYRNGRV